MEERLSTPPVDSVTRLIVHGASGRMGARLCELAQRDASFALAGALTRAGSSHLGAPAPGAPAGARAPLISTNALETQAIPADVVIDFSSDQGTRAALAVARRAGAALLVGTTALAGETLDALRRAAGERAVLVAPNTSLGVAVLASLVAQAARALPVYDASIVEAHHGGKKDAPSGTAKRLAEAARQAGSPVRDDQVVSMRGGDVVGEHTVRFAGPGEYLELTHRATSRDVFVRGALRTARWLHGRAPGWWTIEDVLGFGA